MQTKTDPFVQEVRQSRQEHARKFDFNLRRIFEDLRARQQETNHPVVSFSKKNGLRATGS